MSSSVSQRTFTSGDFWCTRCAQNIPIPRVGVDLYVGTYPCTPWSRRGKRTGYDHPDAEVSIIGFKTIAFIGRSARLISQSFHLPLRGPAIGRPIRLRHVVQEIIAAGIQSLPGRCRRR